MLNRSFYLMASKLLGYGIRLILPYFLVRLLTKADFGAYRQFFLLEVYIASLFQVGLNQALYYFIPRDEKNAGSYFLNSLVLNLGIFVLVFAIVGVVAGPVSSWLNMPILQSAFWSLSLYTILLMLTTACDCYLTARQSIRASAAFEVGGQVLASIGTVAAAYSTRELAPVLVALVVSRAVQLLAMLAYVHWRLRGFAAQRYWHGWREQIRYGFVLGFGGTLGTMLARLHDFFVSRYYGTEAYAVYSVGCTEIPIIQMLTQSLAIVSLGQFAALEKGGDWDGMRRLWDRVMASTWAVAIPVVFGLAVFAKPIVNIMFTAAYAGAVPIFELNTILKISLLFNATLVLRAMDRNGVTMWINGATLLVAPFLLYAGMLVGGMIGIIAAQATLMIVSRVISVVIMNRITKSQFAYWPRPREVFAFYGDAWAVLRRLVHRTSESAGGRT